MNYNYILDLENKGIPKEVFEPFSYLKNRIKPRSIKVLRNKETNGTEICLEQDGLVILSVEREKGVYKNSVFKTIVIDKEKRLVFLDEYNSKSNSHKCAVLSDDFIIINSRNLSFYNKGTTRAFYAVKRQNFVDAELSELAVMDSYLIEKELDRFGLSCFKKISDRPAAYSERNKEIEEYYKKYIKFTGLVNSVINNLEQFLADHESISDTRVSYSLTKQLEEYGCSFFDSYDPLYKKFDDVAFLVNDKFSYDHFEKRNSEGDRLTVKGKDDGQNGLVTYYGKDKAFLIGLTKDNVVRVYDASVGIFLIEQIKSETKGVRSKFSFYDKGGLDYLYKQSGVDNVVDFLGWFNFKNALANAIEPDKVATVARPLNDVIESFVSDPEYYDECVKWFNATIDLKSGNHGRK